MAHNTNYPNNISGFKPGFLQMTGSDRKPFTNVAKFMLTLIFATCLTSCTYYTTYTPESIRYDFPLQEKGDYYTRDFHWEFEGHSFDLTIEMSKCIYQYYHNLPKDQPYINFTQEYAGYRYQYQLAHDICKLAEPYHFNRRQMAQYLLVFVQSIGYTSDPVIPSHHYARYLVEVLMEGRQDCSCASVAVSSLYRAMGLYSALIVIPNQTHMAAGISLGDTTGIYYVGESGRTYEFAECTNLGWDIGKSSTPNDSVFVYEVRPLDTLINSPHQFAHDGRSQFDTTIMQKDIKPSPEPLVDTSKYVAQWELFKHLITQK